jgi:hypothetical protein
MPLLASANAAQELCIGFRSSRLTEWILDN